MGISLALCAALALLTQIQHTNNTPSKRVSDWLLLIATSDGCDVVIVDEFVSGQ